MPPGTAPSARAARACWPGPPAATGSPRLPSGAGLRPAVGRPGRVRHGRGHGPGQAPPEVDPVADHPDDVAVRSPGCRAPPAAPASGRWADRPSPARDSASAAGGSAGSTRSTTTGSSVWRSLLPDHQGPDVGGGRPVDGPAGVARLVGADPAGLAGSGRDPQRGVTGRVARAASSSGPGSPNRGATCSGRGRGTSTSRAHQSRPNGRARGHLDHRPRRAPRGAPG